MIIKKSLSETVAVIGGVWNGIVLYYFETILIIATMFNISVNTFVYKIFIAKIHRF